VCLPRPSLRERQIRAGSGIHDRLDGVEIFVTTLFGALRMLAIVTFVQGRAASLTRRFLAVKDCRDAAAHTLSDKESEIARLTTVLGERSALVDAQIGEIAAPSKQIQTLNEQLTHAGEDARALEERWSTALRVLSKKESELAKMATALDERSELVESQKVGNTALTIQRQTLNERFTEASQEARALEEHRNAALRTLSERESELATVTSALKQSSALVDAQKVTNSALRTQVQALNERLIQAGREARALEERHDVERMSSNQ
jgi:chromosome segregation ATPase